MSNIGLEAIIAFCLIVGFALGLFVNHRGIKERDERIKELEGELCVKQNVCESNNATITRLKKELKQLKSKVK